MKNDGFTVVLHQPTGLFPIHSRFLCSGPSFPSQHTSLFVIIVALLRPYIFISESSTSYENESLYSYIGNSSFRNPLRAEDEFSFIYLSLMSAGRSFLYCFYLLQLFLTVLPSVLLGNVISKIWIMYRKVV